VLWESRPYAAIYRYAHELLLQDESADLSIRLHCIDDRRRYNLPITNEVVIIIPGNEDGKSPVRAISSFTKGPMLLHSKPSTTATLHTSASTTPSSSLPVNTAGTGTSAYKIHIPRLSPTLGEKKGLPKRIQGAKVVQRELILARMGNAAP
jgi:hypothetical protein